MCTTSLGNTSAHIFCVATIKSTPHRAEVIHGAARMPAERGTTSVRCDILELPRVSLVTTLCIASELVASIHSIVSSW
jgi:hypothetical protein